MTELIIVIPLIITGYLKNNYELVTRITMINRECANLILHINVFTMAKKL